MIAMSSGGVGEFVRSGLEGHLVESDSQMAATTAALLVDPVALSRMQQHNEQTDPVMTWSHVTDQHLAVYRTQHALSALAVRSAS
ncbi:hypothetical protein E0H75_10765 [Kribbella capetownensis]|uniref:Glycosyltransferase n=1 Tax=Kribbella capetownensis TaxID=1572659 RepID=A0A4R0JUK3_9ACTN|nr:hypothetical protein [Kribbella capetownensis]TCC50669.1 hypothetical protein E0H75_10765 [Kribbella capetownensis]